MFFLTGGASHVDSFDPKPDLQAEARYMPSPWKIHQWGESGLAATELFPHISSQIDDLCLIRSMHGDHGCHFQATLGMHTGSVTVPMPSLGSWVSYALGSENPNLPSHIVIADEAPYAGSLVWDANFLPAYHQGVRIRPGDEPIPHISPPDSVAAVQDLEMAVIRRVNARHGRTRYDDSSLQARMLAFDTALGLQNTAPQVFDLNDESQATLDLYGIGRQDRRSFGFQCLLARRLAERGVRFIELFDIGSHNNWDAHGDIETHGPLARKIDRPIASLLADLKMRGLFDETLVIFCTEFGRTPTRESRAGRSHHNRVFTCWLAGGGVKRGFAHGASDRYGERIAENPVHVHDFHATILHLMGLDHQRLTHHHNGRDFRLTDVHGNVVREILA